MRNDIIDHYTRICRQQGHYCTRWRGDQDDKPRDFCIVTSCESCDGTLRLRRTKGGKVVPEGDLHMVACPARGE